MVKFSCIDRTAMSGDASDSEKLILYRHVGCPYCERVIRVTEELGIDVHSRFVVPAHSERGHVKHVSGTRSVPVLIDEEKSVTMNESANIIEYLNHTRGGAS